MTEEPDEFDRGTAEAYALFALAAAEAGVEVSSPAQDALVRMAITAGVLGHMQVMRDDTAGR